MIHRTRSFSALAFAAALLALAALAGSGCGGKSKQKQGVEPPFITHTDADDIVQTIATTVSANNGGWYCTIKAMAESLAVDPLHPVPPSPTGAGDSTVFNVAQAGVTYQFTRYFFHGDQSFYATRDTATDHLEANVSADNGTFTNVNGISGTYGLNCDSFLFVVYNLHAVYDTLDFSMLADDSVYAIVRSTITPDSARAWYHSGNAFDFEPSIQLLKSTLTTTPYPVGGEVDWFVIDAAALKSSSRLDVAYDDFAEGVMTFPHPGTSVAHFRLIDTTPDPNYNYDYTIDLDTGEIHRLN